MGWRVMQYISTTTITVPAELIWVSGCGGGGGGGGGDPTPGGGGSGGGPSFAIRMFPLFVTPGETLSLVIGSGGAGGAPGSNGGYGGETKILRGTIPLISGLWANCGLKGTPSAGGASVAVPYGDPNVTYGAYFIRANFAASEFANAKDMIYFASTAGGALSVAGGDRLAASVAGGIYNPGAAGGASGGGGGHGGIGPFAAHNGVNWGGIGGSNGSAGSNGSGYGCGGGGGSGNSAGGDGSPGVLWIAWFEDTLSAAGIRSALGLASDNLDSQLAALDPPTTTEIRDALIGLPVELLTLGDVLPGGAVNALASLLSITAAINATADGIEDRLAEQVADGPVLVIAAPAAGQTTVWIACYDHYGNPEAGVKITLRCIKNALGGALDSAPITMTSDAEGLASTQIPRGVGAKYQVSRGSGGSVTFNSVDEETLELPPLLGAP